MTYFAYFAYFATQPSVPLSAVQLRERFSYLRLTLCNGLECSKKFSV